MGDTNYGYKLSAPKAGVQVGDDLMGAELHGPSHGVQSNQTMASTWSEDAKCEKEKTKKSYGYKLSAPKAGVQVGDGLVGAELHGPSHGIQVGVAPDNVGTHMECSLGKVEANV